MKSLIVLPGMVFGRLTVLKEGKTLVYGKSTIRTACCRCSCGTIKDVTKSHLVRGKTKSCGCYASDSARAKMTIHGHARQGAKTKTFRCWESMIYRCSNPNCKDADYYLNKGITVCERWKEYSNFLADMGERPKGMTLDRIETNGNYEPDNCRWATQTTQCRNRSNNVLVTIKGVTRCVGEWCEVLHLNYGSINSRIHSGWTPERALNTPIVSRFSRSRQHQK